ncbi:MAG: TauD/TfdA family dioxygenase [Spirochaetaceae bacterium]|nr:TauD/TfdA family dioxygenase [Spirochaetaceae bacterium]
MPSTGCSSCARVRSRASGRSRCSRRSGGSSRTRRARRCRWRSRTSTRRRRRPGELVFHNDYAYDPDPIPGISMYGALVDGDVTPTCFASASRVLERLPADLVDRLRGLEASHACFLARPDGSGERAIRPEPLVPRGEPGWGPEHYWATHPVIIRNAAGVEALFVCLQHTDRILGLPREESDALLARLYAELYAADRVYAHRWRPHDLVIWDNLAVQHARPAPNDRPRTLRRFHLANRDLTADYLRIARERGFV